jgi:hypothetical protein
MLTAALASSLIGSLALAEIDFSWTGNREAQNIGWAYDSTANWDSGFSTNFAEGRLGTYIFNEGAYEGYCWELEAPVSRDPQSYEIMTFDDLDMPTQERAVFLASLYDQWYEGVRSSGNSDMGVALSILTNEIMEENYDFIPGTFLLTDVQSQSFTNMGAVQFTDISEDTQFFYNEMINSLDFGTQAMIDGLEFYVSTTGEFQNFVTYVPAPSILGLAGLAGLARRRRRA